MLSNNPQGVSLLRETPDNQQERPGIAYWICGFVDGEGCFSVSLIKNKTTSLGWQLFPEFVVTQEAKSLKALQQIKDFFQCGNIYPNHCNDNHKEVLYRYCVRAQNELCNVIIPFFKKYPLFTAKRNDFEKFVVILGFMRERKHLTFEGLKNIAKIIETMNRKIPSRFLESSETTRRTLKHSEKI